MSVLPSKGVGRQAQMRVTARRLSGADHGRRDGGVGLKSLKKKKKELLKPLILVVRYP